MPPSLDALRDATLRLLDPHEEAVRLAPEVGVVADGLRGASSFVPPPHGDIVEGETRTDHGLALSPTMAAMCADDVLRTIAFLRGSHEAIRTARRRAPGRPVRVLYAGCGPYATLAVPLMAVLGSEEARFTLLDLHAGSVESARAVVGSFGLEASVSVYEEADATAYEVDPEAPPDVIVTEVLQAALSSEPQVAVTRHLLAQAPHALLVPASIRLDLVLAPAGERVHEEEGLHVGTAFELSREAVALWDVEERERLPGRRLRWPRRVPRELRPFITTTIQTFGAHRLGLRDSGLTMPQVADLSGEIVPQGWIQFEYLLGPRPRLHGVVLPPEGLRERIAR